jgi:hypothetical protein
MVNIICQPWILVVVEATNGYICMSKLPSEGAVSGCFDSALHQFLEKPKDKIGKSSHARWLGRLSQA